jgi:hypothetical protein
VAQNEVIFERKGLKVIAATQDFAICMKLNRLTCGEQIPGERGEEPAYDVSDAVSYLHHYVKMYGSALVTEAEIRRWARRYDQNTDTKAIRRVMREYRCRYGIPGIVRSPSEGAILSIASQLNGKT